MAIVNTNYALPDSQTDNPYIIGEDDENLKKWKELAKANGWYNGTGNPFMHTDTPPDDYKKDDTDTPENPVTGNTGKTETPTKPAAETQMPTTGNDSFDTLLKQINDMTKSGSISEEYKAAILAAVKAQQMTTQQAIDKINFQKDQADQARVKANREADMTFSRAINPTGKINQNIRSAGLAGSGWQETSQVGLTNAYQNALNTNTSDYNNAVKELNLAISQAQQSGDIATMQAIQTYAIQLAQQLYQEARAAVADSQWERSFALQKAAFDLEHASQTGSTGSYSSGSSNSGYSGNTGSTSYTKNNGSSSYNDPSEPEDSADTVSEDESNRNAAWADYEMEQMLNSGIVGEDVLYYTKEILAKYIDGMNNADAQALLDKYGLVEEDL